MANCCETTGYASCSLPPRRNLLGNVTAVLMISDERASSSRDLVHAMARCTLRRLAAAGRLVLAPAAGIDGVQLAQTHGIEPEAIVDQGEGNLGERLARVWRHVGIAVPIAFFGVNGPDVPDFALARIPAELRRVDAAIGPTHDGGYWTLAARRYRPWLIHQIDWGKPSLYDSMCRRAAEADIELAVLPLWPTAVRPSDVEALRSRLTRAASSTVSGHGAASAASLDALRELADVLNQSVVH